MVTANVDITALKARHPLGDTVEAAGVRLRGRGRVRQGVCPFHDEAAGQLHGVRRLGAVLLLRLRRGRRRAGLHPAGRGPVAARGHRAAGRQPRACAQGRHSSSRNAASEVRRAASPRPRPADGGGALLRRSSPALPRSAGVPGLAGRRPVRRSPPRSRLCAGRRAAAGPGVPAASRRSASGTAGCSWSGERSGSPAWSSFPTSPAASSAGSSGRAIDPDRTPRFQAPPGPKPVLGLGRLGPAPPWAVVAEGVFDWLALTGWGLPAVAALGTQGIERVASALRGCPRVFLAFDNDDAGREATERLLTLLGRRAAAVALPAGVGDVGELAALPHGRPAFLPPALTGGPLRPLAAPRRFPCGLPSPPRLS